MDVGIIPAQFPVVGEVPAQADHPTLPNANRASSSWDTILLDCNCPSEPNHHSCPATEEYVPKLKQYLLDYYSSSTFNTCEHQPLTMMEGPPMCLMIDPKLKPMAHHSPMLFLNNIPFIEHKLFM